MGVGIVSAGQLVDQRVERERGHPFLPSHARSPGLEGDEGIAQDVDDRMRARTHRQIALRVLHDRLSQSAVVAVRVGHHQQCHVLWYGTA